MQQHVAIRMAGQSMRMRNRHPANPERHSLHKLVRIKPVSNSHGQETADSRGFTRILFLVFSKTRRLNSGFGPKFSNIVNIIKSAEYSFSDMKMLQHIHVLHNPC